MSSSKQPSGDKPSHARTKPWQAAAVVLASTAVALVYAYANVPAHKDPLFWSGVLLVLGSPMPAVFWTFACLALGYGGLGSVGRGALMLMAAVAAGVSLSGLAAVLEALDRREPVSVDLPSVQIVPVPARPAAQPPAAAPASAPVLAR